MFFDVPRKCKRSVFANSTRTVLGFYTCCDRTVYNNIIIVFRSFPKQRLNSLDARDKKHPTLEIYNSIAHKYRFDVLRWAFYLPLIFYPILFTLFACARLLHGTYIVHPIFIIFLK